MVLGYIIVIVLALVFAYYVTEWVVSYNFKQKFKDLTDDELKHVAQNLYDTLDDYGWNWRTAVEYRTAVKWLKERTEV